MIGHNGVGAHNMFGQKAARIALAHALLLAILALASCGFDEIPQAQGDYDTDGSSSEGDDEWNSMTSSATESAAQGLEDFAIEKDSGEVVFPDVSMFDGGIENILYAGKDKVLVYASDFDLYSLAEGCTVGSYNPYDGRVLSPQLFCLDDGGYALTGQVMTQPDDEGLFSGSAYDFYVWYFDGDFSLEGIVNANQLISAYNEDLGARALAVSGDGSRIAIAGYMYGIYLYDVMDDTVTKLADLNSPIDGVQNISVSKLSFAQDGEWLVFTGSELDEGGSGSAPCYGSVGLDGRNLDCNNMPGYALSGSEMYVFDGEVWLPEDYMSATGRLLVLDDGMNFKRLIEFDGGDTGADGVFASDYGRFCATAELCDDGASRRIRIYDADDGCIVAERTIDFGNYNVLYFKVRILDDYGACIFIGGRGQETFMENFYF